MRFIGLFVSAVALAACAGGEEPRADREVTVVAEPLRFLSEENVIEAIGTARAARSAQIFPEVSGQVVAVRFRQGGFVRAGQVLVELDARQERLALRLAEVRVQEAEQLLARYRRIEDTGALSESQIEAGETALAAARIERDQAAVALSERTIRAPFAGHVGLSEVDVGDRVTPESLIAQLDQRGRLFVDFNAPEAVFRRLRPGETVEIVAFADPANPIAGTIEAIDSAIEQEQRSYRARTVVANPADRLRPGMSFSVRFVDSGLRRPAVPEAAVVWSGEGSSIFVVRNGKAARIPVTITSRREGSVLLDAELAPRALVIVEGVQKVREGQAVKLVRPPAQGETEVEVARTP